MQPYNPDQSPYISEYFHQLPPPAPKRARHGLLIIGILALAIGLSLLLCTGIWSAFVDANTPAHSIHSIEQPVIKLHRHP